ncbi:hypothetical protein B0A48_04083 [Cryoendolithus antarcticus]|uniref:Heterokaryon incompatibility domain-containing protein n=1 Tax=Cryoendolithus antarcticus TaxID=1507870 RepID=A0A1V8THB7_9PEZI|nr:hypothetical protein B0A48_04083 [Cryoendolithus antarcticus]
MSIVYRSAVSNFIFLGNKDATSALRGIAVLSHELLKETQEVELADVLRPRGQWASSNKPLTTTPPYEDLREFFDLPWFRRVWVIQEATLAKKNVCICGVAIFDLISVVRAGVWLLHKEHFLNDAGLTRTLNRALGLFDLLDHDQGYYATHRHTLYNLLRMIQGLECKIPSDRVFGIYGMLEHFQIPGWQDLRPDYALPMERVFEKATRTALADMNGDLLPLQQVSHVDEIAMRRGPSWVPDYSISNQDERLSNELRAQFEASSGSKRDSQLDFGFSNAGQLAVAGFVIGTIVGTTAPIFCKRLSTAQHLSERFDRIEALVEQHCPDDIQSRFALSTVPLTLTGGQRASCSELMEWEAFRNSMNGSLQGTLEHEVRDKASLPASLGLYLDTLEACLNRKVFAVENGFIGLGPLLTDCNDIVVVLEGLQWPAVLRPSMTGFYFLGVAYVHDIMDVR